MAVRIRGIAGGFLLRRAPSMGLVLGPRGKEETSQKVEARKKTDANLSNAAGNAPRFLLQPVGFHCFSSDTCRMECLLPVAAVAFLRTMRPLACASASHVACFPKHWACFMALEHQVYEPVSTIPTRRLCKGCILIGGLPGFM